MLVRKVVPIFLEGVKRWFGYAACCDPFQEEWRPTW